MSFHLCFLHSLSSLFFFNAPSTTETSTLSLHDALPISFVCSAGQRSVVDLDTGAHRGPVIEPLGLVHWHDDAPVRADRKSTRLNSSHVAISYAVFCLKKKKRSKKIHKNR